jgi:hypothetical protein
MRTLFAAIAAFAMVLSPLPAQSDTDVKGAVATQFTRSKGASLAGQNVHWHVAAKVFHVPKKSRGGVSLYMSHGIGILTDARSSAVDEVMRRGGQACVRGRVVRVPEKEREPGDPSYAIVVSSLSHRKD